MATDGEVTLPLRKPALALNSGAKVEVEVTERMSSVRGFGLFDAVGFRCKFPALLADDPRGCRSRVEATAVDSWLMSQAFTHPATGDGR